MIVVVDRVWSRWRELCEQEAKPSIWLLLSTSGAPLGAVASVEDAVQDALAALAGVGRSEFYPGYANVAAVPGGVAVEAGRGIEGFERFVELVGEGLQRRGVTGTLDLFEPRGVEPLPFKAALVECRLRVAGQRERAAGPHYRWRAETDAWGRLLGQSVRWCTSGGGVGASLGVGTMPRVAVGADEDLGALLQSAIDHDELGVADCAAGATNRWRMVAVPPSRTLVTLVEAGDAIQNGGWREAVREMTDFIKAEVSVLAYAFIKHGSDVYTVRSGYSLAEDWPARPGVRGLMRRELSFEDSYAPDAFAVQLLGAGYAGRIPSGPDWRETRITEYSSLLEHIRPELWFESEFVAFGGGYRNSVAALPPQVLARARADFADILFTDELAASQR